MSLADIIGDCARPALEFDSPSLYIDLIILNLASLLFMLYYFCHDSAPFL